MNQEELNKIRHNLIVKDNRLIQNSRYSLSLMEHKVLNYLVLMIKPDDKPDHVYRFNCRDFQFAINWGRSDIAYNRIKGLLTKLASIQWWMDINENEEALVRWFNIVHMDKGRGDIFIKFHEDIFPFLFNLQGHPYTSSAFETTSLMKHKYSIRIYELLKSYQNNKVWIFENGTKSKYDLQRRIVGVDDKKNPDIPVGWSHWSNFQKDVLEPAVEEINRYTDLIIAYEGFREDMSHRRTRGVETIRFYITKKTSIEQEATDNIIEGKYREISYNKLDKTPIVDKEFFSEYEQRLEEEESVIKEREAKEFNERIEKSKYPLLTSHLGKDFDDEEIENLFTLAIRKGKVLGEISFDKWDIFSTDYIGDCYEAIKMDKKNTRTTIYNRLVDAVKKDYNKVVDMYVDKYR